MGVLGCALLASPGAAQRAALPASSSPARASLVDTVRLWSQALGTTKRVLVHRPTGLAGRRWPVLYYLHGLGGDETTWSTIGRLPQVMDSLAALGRGQAIVVMPDGDDGFWTTWHLLPDLAACRAARGRAEPAEQYCVPWPHYDDYIAHDLVRAIDARYPTIATRAGRALAGVEMGGFGAVTLALRYPDRFAAAVSHSGWLVPRYVGPHPFAPPAQVATTPEALRAAVGADWARLAPVFGRDTLGWQRREPTWLLAQARRAGRLPALYLDGAPDDARVDQSRAFRATLVEAGVSHAWVEWPASTDGPAWARQVGAGAAWLLARVGARTR